MRCFTSRVARESVDCEYFFFFKQKTAYEMLLCDWSSDVCSSDLLQEVELLFRDGANARGFAAVHGCTNQLDVTSRQCRDDQALLRDARRVLVRACFEAFVQRFLLLEQLELCRQHRDCSLTVICASSGCDAAGNRDDSHH